MKHFKSIIAVALTAIILVSVCVVGVTTAGATSTGVGLAEWALNAYYSNWSYVYGGSSAGAVDCSGLIYSYCGGARVGTAQLSTATESGNVSSGIPRVHGLGLYQPGHVGVYVGNGMAVDARNESEGVCYESTASKSWTKWFKLAAVTYPTTGWEKFNGNYYYYENGQYVVSCTKTIGGETYTFAASGISNKTPSNVNAVADNSNTNSSSNNNSSSNSNNSSSNSSSSSSSSSVLQLGSSGKRVTKLQNRLTELGFYSGSITGYFGELTQEAYKAFQTAAGVTVDGIAGKSDLKILYSDSAPLASSVTADSNDSSSDTFPYQIGDQGDEIVKIQERLTELNYFNGETTGYYGDVTSVSVVAFQNANGLTATGKVNKKTYKTLFSDSAVENPLYATEEDEEDASQDDEDSAQEDTSEQSQETSDEQTTDETATEQDETTSVYELAQDNLEAAQQVALTASKVSKSALAKVQSEENKAVKVSSDDKNSNFALWLFLVVGIVLVAAGITFTVNKSRKKYAGAHTKGRENPIEENVRYW